MTRLENPEQVAAHVATAAAALSCAHLAAGETDGTETDQSGPVRDMLYGLGTACEALVGLINDGIEAASA